MILKSIFRYINIVHDYVYYRKVYYINIDNIPPDGSSVIVVSNHQNAINDPLALEFCFRKRHFHIFARASLFASRFGIERAYGSYQELYQDSDVDLVYIAGPHSHHKQEMLEAGAIGAMMSGSGPTVFGLFENRAAARTAQKNIREKSLARQVYVTNIHSVRRD